MTVACSRQVFAAKRHVFRSFSSVTTTSIQSSSANPKNLPKKIILLRHGRSLGNEDESLFSRLPDWKIGLSTEGKDQARKAGRTIQRIVGTDPIMFYVSPYTRTKQTYDELQHHISSDVLFSREDPRLREQDFGNFQDTELIQQAKKTRVDFGRFFFRFPDGESGADVYDRISAFCQTFIVDCEQLKRPDSAAVFVTHGITARLFVMRWMHWTVTDFEQLHNPNNCALIVLERHDDAVSGPSYRLTRESSEMIKAPSAGGIGRALKLGQILAKENARSANWDFGHTAWGL